VIELKENWMKRRWFDFRNGHALYLIFILTGANFILIFHRLLIERIPILNEIFGNLAVFAIIFIIAYIPLAIIIGTWHRKYQLKIDVEQSMRNNLILTKMFRTMLDIQTGQAKEEEIENLRAYLKSIEKDMS
jgi:hypothetical protein